MTPEISGWKLKFKKTGLFFLTSVQQMLPTLTLQWPKPVWNIKTRICCDEHVKCIFPPSWIWTFGVSSRSQSHKLQKLKWHPWSKDHVLHFILVDKTIYEAVFTREKQMFCSIMAPGHCCKTHILLVYLELQINRTTSVIDGCLSCILLPRSSAESPVHALFANWF